MKSKVKLSRFSLILTILINAVLTIGCIATFGDKGKFVILLIILLTLVTFGLLYAPLSITADEDAVTVRSALRRIRIPIRDIESVELFQPTLGAIRIYASGGYMGYWGMFREGGFLSPTQYHRPRYQDAGLWTGILKYHFYPRLFRNIDYRAWRRCNWN